MGRAYSTLGERRNANRVLVRNAERKKERLRRRCEDNIKMDFREIRIRKGAYIRNRSDVVWINLAQDGDKWRAVVNAAKNLQVP
jgi:hypothetical protein